MNISWFLAWQSIKYRKRNSLLIGLALVVSTMFLIFLGFGGTSGIYMIAENNRNQYGEQMLVVTGSEADLERRLKTDDNIIIKGKLQILGTVFPKQGNIPLQVGFVDDVTTEQTARIRLKEGKLPSSEDEVAIEEVAFYRLGIQNKVKIGDTITFKQENLTGVTEEKSYRLSGILEDYSLTWHKYYQSINQNADSLLFTPPSILVAPQKQPTRNIWLLNTSYRLGETIIKVVGEQNFIAINTTVHPDIETLFFDGQVGSRYNSVTDWVIIGVLVFIIAAVCILLNAFLISMDRRREQIALLRTVGGSSAQAARIVFLEAILLWIIAMPVGILLGGCLSFSAIQLFASISGLNLLYHFWPPTIAIVIGLSFLLVLLSVLLPMIKVAKTSPLSLKQDRIQCKSHLKSHKTETLFLFRFSLTFMKQGNLRIVVTVISFVICFFMLNLMALFSNVWSKNTSQLREADYRILTRSAIKNKDDLAFLMEDSITVRQPTGLAEQLRNVLKPVGVVTKLDPFFYLEIEKDKVDSYWKDFSHKGDSVLVSISESTRKKYDIAKNRQLLYPQVLIADSNALELIKKDVEEGHIDETAILSGNEIILIVPDYEKSMSDSNAKFLNDDKVSLLSKTKLMVGDDIGFLSILQSSGETEAHIIRKTAKIGAIIRSTNFKEYQNQISVIVGPNVLADWGFTGNILQIDAYLPDNIDVKNMEIIAQQTVETVDNVELYSRMESILQEQQEHRTQSAVIYMITGLLVLLGILGLYNTMASLVYNRQREIAILRAVGMTKGQVLKMLLIATVIYSLCVTIVGTVIFLSFITIAPLPFENPFSFISFPVFVGTIVGTILLCITTAFLPGYKVMESIIADKVKCQN